MAVVLVVDVCHEQFGCVLFVAAAHSREQTPEPLVTEPEVLPSLDSTGLLLMRCGACLCDPCNGRTLRYYKLRPGKTFV